MEWRTDLSYRTELQDFFDRLYKKKAQLDRHRPLARAVLHNIRESLSVEWTYHSNSIEGNTLTLRETQMVLREGITIKGKSLQEHLEAKNHEIALEFLFGLVGPDYRINNKDILDIHALVLQTIEREFAGRFRNAGVRITGANFLPPNALKIPGLMDDLIDFVHTNPQGYNDLELAAIFHHRFVWIHPFFDGNGRMVRLAMNLLLMRAGFPPAIILRNDRKKYYEALQSANNGHYHKFMVLMAQALERSLNIYLNAVPGSDTEYLEISDLVQEERLPYGQEYISLLARQGKIDAWKQGRNWLTSREAVIKYARSKGK